ncbi:Hypothetical protein SMAX5B_001507 [Scophthalmus maximus]|uniref:Uncharacterized protein n=1 Tax=Scophthalmus maximus TaxID=52904 RepID=A0A2U9B3D3_SCOMX|nr:Hypothetical protein SMAX5B_001507 [Scophthalmus maximus]
MESTLDVDPGVPEEDIDVTPPSPVAECGSAECRRIRHEYERELDKVKAERDEFCGEVRLLRRKLQKQLRSSKRGRTSAVENQEEPVDFRQRQGEPREADKPPTIDGAHHEGLDPRPKMSENAISKVSRVKTFIIYMANNQTRLSDWLFLDNMSRIHGPGVYANMTDNEVEEAKTLGQDRGYLLHIKEHNTNRTFGEAQMFLNPAEFAWLERWMAIKKSLPDANQFVLYTKGKGPSKNLNANLQSAWKDMGLAGVINFTLIRTAVATYVS